MSDVLERVSYLLEKESVYPRTTFSDKTLCKNRRILLAWVSEVCEKHAFCQKTKELAIRIVDYYLIKFLIDTAYLQLLGITAIYISKKLHENQSMNDMDTFLENFTHEYTTQQLFKLEVVITQFLRWELNLVTPSDYLEEFVEVRKRAVIQDIILFIMLSKRFVGCSNFEIFLMAYYMIFEKMPVAVNDQTRQSIIEQAALLKVDLAEETPVKPNWRENNYESESSSPIISMSKKIRKIKSK